MKQEYAHLNPLLVPILGGLAVLSLGAVASESPVPVRVTPSPIYAVAPKREDEEFPMLYYSGKPKGAKDFRGLTWLSVEDRREFNTRQRHLARDIPRVHKTPDNKL